jgi:hypothetical protein
MIDPKTLANLGTTVALFSDQFDSVGLEFSGVVLSVSFVPIGHLSFAVPTLSRVSVLFKPHQVSSFCYQSQTVLEKAIICKTSRSITLIPEHLITPLALCKTF